VRELPCEEKIVRAKNTVKNDDMAKLGEIEAEMSGEMDELERSYRR
jgi:hypothetical protein